MIRRATADDARGIARVMQVIASERRYSAIDKAWPVDEEARYIRNLSDREAIHVAVDNHAAIIGLQVLDRWSALESSAHVGQLGTFLLPMWRRQGIGRQLWECTAAFARKAGYRKLVIYVRGSNLDAQSFYQSIDFQPCGRLARHVLIDGVEDDEIMMETFL